jgi:hypothetical protein
MQTQEVAGYGPRDLPNMNPGRCKMCTQGSAGYRPWEVPDMGEMLDMDPMGLPDMDPGRCQKRTQGNDRHRPGKGQVQTQRKVQYGLAVIPYTNIPYTNTWRCRLRDQGNAGNEPMEMLDTNQGRCQMQNQGDDGHKSWRMPDEDPGRCRIWTCNLNALTFESVNFSKS